MSITGMPVHVVSLGFDADRVVVPLAQIGCERLYAFEEDDQRVPARWRSISPSQSIRNVVSDCRFVKSRGDLPTLYDQMEKIVAAETKEGNRVFINVSSGSRVFTAAAAILSAKYPVELYYVHSKSYYVERDFSSGVERVELLNQTVRLPKDIAVDATLAFVVMPFSADLDPIYEDVLAPIIRESALRPVRADEIFDNRQIMDDIWDNIERSRVVIADLTGKNPNVFYETGIAHALGKEVILMTQNLQDVPFDLRPMRCIVYANTLRGAEKLTVQMKKTLQTVLERTGQSEATRRHNNGLNRTVTPRGRGATSG